MQRFLSIALALCLGLTFSLDADAKRFGGGKSWGAKPKHSQMQKQQAQPAAGQTTGKQPATAGAKPGIGGMLMGLAAGGLLASLFMGGAFEGLQIMDMLIFGLIAFVIFKLLASRRRQMPQAATAGGPAMHREVHNANQSIFGGSSAAARPVIQAPAWFNEKSFLQAAEGRPVADVKSVAPHVVGSRSGDGNIAGTKDCDTEAVLASRPLVGQSVAPQNAAVDIDVIDSANIEYCISGRRIGNNAEDGRRRHL